MKNLGRHIETLLQDNDCVVVPGLGGFIARDVPASYDEEEQLFFPPTRSVVFNERLTFNDGLLTGRYMHDYQVSFSDATRMVEKAVDKLRDTLAIEGTATLPGVGCLHQDIHNTFMFEPEGAGIASPALFGLSALSIRPLDALSTESTVHRPLYEADEQSINIHIGRRALRTVAAAAAVALLLIVFAIPTANEHRAEMAGLPGLSLRPFKCIPGLDIDAPVTCPTPCMGKATETETDTESSVQQIDTEIIAAESPAEETVSEEPAPVQTPAVSEKAPEQKPAAKPVAAITVAPSKYYHLIVGSLPNRKGADDMVAKYVGLGFSNASIVESDGRYRISIASYTDKAEANAEISRLRQGNIVKGVWLLPVMN